LQLASGHLVVVAVNTYTMHQVLLAHAWGFANAEQQVFRWVNYQLYLVMHQDSAVLYSRNATTFDELFLAKGLMATCTRSPGASASS
jgi:hypothetical protein